MAVLFDAAADRLERTSGDRIDLNAAYTWMAWVLLDGDQNAHSTAMCINNGTSSGDNLDFVGTFSDGTTYCLVVSNGGFDLPTGTALSLDTWYHMTLRRNAAADCDALLDGVVDITSTQDTAGRGSVANMTSGALQNQEFPLDGRICAQKAWTVSLSDAQVVQEMQQYLPIRSANFWEAWPGTPGATERLRAWSSNQRGWTASGTLTDVAGPPGVKWIANRHWAGFTAAAGGATPKGVFGLALHGPLGGPIG